VHAPSLLDASGNKKGFFGLTGR